MRKNATRTEGVNFRRYENQYSAPFTSRIPSDIVKATNVVSALNQNHLDVSGRKIWHKTARLVADSGGQNGRDTGRKGKRDAPLCVTEVVVPPFFWKNFKSYPRSIIRDFFSFLTPLPYPTHGPQIPMTPSPFSPLLNSTFVIKFGVHVHRNVNI